jgi:hypothetical protein
MSNASTIRRQVGGSQQLTIAPLLGTTITTTASPFLLNNNALTLSGGGCIPLSAGVTGLYAGTGQVIQIHAAGVITGMTAGTTTLLIGLYQVPASSLPLASTVNTAALLVTAGGVLIAASSAVTAPAATTQGSFAVDAFVQLDGQSNLEGSFEYSVLNTVAGPAAITSVKSLVGEADLNFVLAATLGGAETGVIVTLDEFSLSLV